MLFGLIGNPISHSKSPSFFNNLFSMYGLPHKYKLFPIDNIENIKEIIENNKSLVGLNVTSPFKELVIPYVDKLSKEAREVNAVNVISISRKNDITHIKGYNTDCIALKDIFKDIKSNLNNAIILGTAGAAKAVAWALKYHNINYTFVSRDPSNKKNTISYTDLSSFNIYNADIIINATPLGMDGKSIPMIPYQNVKKGIIFFDLIYEPKETPFLKKALEMECIPMNGYEMLIKQAYYSWDIWFQYL